MSHVDRRWWSFVLVAVCACQPALKEDQHTNQPPTVWLAAGPPEGSVGTYYVELFWGGWDPDGEISHYEFLISDNTSGIFNPADTVGVDWRSVYSNDSTFTFSADSLVDTGPPSQRALFMRSHTFFIRAVDMEGLRSSEPAHRSFTSRTLSPIVRVDIPPDDLGITAADMPPISTFRWTATDWIDGDDTEQEPDSVQWAMISTRAYDNDYVKTINHLRSPESAEDWYPWVWYRAPLDSGKSWTTPPLDFGNYVFAIRAKDEAGAVTPILEEPVNVRRIKIAARVAGPTFLLQNVFVGRILASSCDYPVTIADIAAGVKMSFSMSACARDYGGTVVGYRYGWDIIDPNDPDQWEIDYTPFVGSVANTPARDYDFGTHTFTAEVIDNSGFCSRIEVKVNIVRFSGERNVLVVDDFRADEAAAAGWVASRGGLPSDAEHDAFWLDMVSNVDRFDPTRDMLATSLDREIPLTTIAAYKNLIWSVYGNVSTNELSDLPSLYAYIQYKSKSIVDTPDAACEALPGGGGKVLPNALALAMQAGVHVLIAGTHPVQNVMPRGTNNNVLLRWPLLPLHELEPGASQFGTEPTFLNSRPGDQGFAFRELCLDAIDFGWLTTQRGRILGTGNNRRYCAVTGWRTLSNSIANLRDHTMRSAHALDPSFASLALRSEAAGPGMYYNASSQGIDAEVYNPEYFRAGAACAFVPAEPPDCFEPIYGLVCLDAAERTYDQPVAFWSGAFADVVIEDAPGAVGARSVVFGFPPVFFEPAQVKPAMEFILFDEWQVPRAPAGTAAQ